MKRLIFATAAALAVLVATFLVTPAVDAGGFVSGRTGVVSFSKAATIADWKGIQTILNTAGWALDANGASITTATASGAMITVGGMPNARITAELKFITPTEAGGEDVGVIIHWGSNVAAGDRNYILVRQQGGSFKITQIAGGSGTLIASTTYALAQDTWATIVAQRVGETVSATIDGGNAISGTIPLATVPAVGSFGFRSGFTTAGTISCRSFTVEMWQ